MLVSRPVSDAQGAATPMSAAIHSVQLRAVLLLMVHLPPPSAAMVPTLYAPTSLRLSPNETIAVNATRGCWSPAPPPPHAATITAAPSTASLVFRNLIPRLLSAKSNGRSLFKTRIVGLPGGGAAQGIHACGLGAPLGPIGQPASADAHGHENLLLA